MASSGTEFPSLCGSCLGPSEFVRMAVSDGTCRLCERACVIHCWRQAAGASMRRTGICRPCATMRNVCQACLRDLQLGLPSQLRDAVLAQVDEKMASSLSGGTGGTLAKRIQRSKFDDSEESLSLMEENSRNAGQRLEDLARTLLKGEDAGVAVSSRQTWVDRNVSAKIAPPRTVPQSLPETSSERLPDHLSILLNRIQEASTKTTPTQEVSIAKDEAAPKEAPKKKPRLVARPPPGPPPPSAIISQSKSDESTKTNSTEDKTQSTEETITK